VIYPEGMALHGLRSTDGSDYLGVINLSSQLAFISASNGLSQFGHQDALRGQVYVNGGTSASSGGTIFFFEGDSSPNYGSISYFSDSFVIGTEAGPISIEPSGTYVGISKDLIPVGTTKTIDLGSSANSWDDAYADDWNTTTHYKTFSNPSDAVKNIKSKKRNVVLIESKTGETEDEIWDYSTMPEWVVKKANPNEHELYEPITQIPSERIDTDNLRIPNSGVDTNVGTKSKSNINSQGIMVGEKEEEEKKERKRITSEPVDALSINRLQVLILQSLQDIIKRVEKLEGE